MNRDHELDKRATDDQLFLASIEAVLADQGRSEQPQTSLEAFCASLANARLEADSAFQERLWETLTMRLAKHDQARYSKALDGSLRRERKLSLAPPPPTPDRIPPYGWSVSQRYLSAIACGLAMLLLLLALSPGLRTVAAQTAQEIRQFVVGSFTRSGGTVEFTPAPPFTVKQPSYLPAGFALVAERYATGMSSNEQSDTAPETSQTSLSVPAQFGRSRQAIERDRSAGPHILLVYETQQEHYIALFERAARAAESLPTGQQRTVANQAAVLQQDNQILTLTWISDGTWIELESTLPEEQLLKVAAGLVTTQKASPATQTTSGPAVVSELYSIPLLSLEEAQRQVTFHIPTPAWLPAGLTLNGVRIMDPWVSLSYIKQDAGFENAGLSINIAPGQVADSRDVGVQRQKVTVNGQPAVYEWVEGKDLGTLSWQQDGFAYSVGGGGLGLSRDDLIRIAETLR